MIKEIKSIGREIKNAILSDYSPFTAFGMLSKNDIEKNQALARQHNEANYKSKAAMDGILPDLFVDPKHCLQKVAPIKKGVDMILNTISAVDLTVKESTKGEVDQDIDENNPVYSFVSRKFIGGINFNYTMITIKDVLCKIAEYNEYYYEYGIIFSSADSKINGNDMTFIDLIFERQLFGCIQNGNSQIIRINYCNQVITFTINSQTGLHEATKVNINGVLIDKLFLHRVSSPVATRKMILNDVTPLSDIVQHAMLYVKALQTNILSMDLATTPAIFLTGQGVGNDKEYVEDISALEKMVKNGKALIPLGGDINLHQIQRKTDIDFMNQIKFAENTILSRFAPLALFDTTPTYNNIEQSYNQFLEGHVQPRIKRVLQTMDHIFFNILVDDTSLYFSLDWNELPIVRQKIYSDAIQAENAGIITKNEARAKMGINGEVEGGDRIYIDNNKQPLDVASNLDFFDNETGNIG